MSVLLDRMEYQIGHIKCLSIILKCDGVICVHIGITTIRLSNNNRLSGELCHLGSVWLATGASQQGPLLTV
jgi:hypothetical protein